MSKERYKLKSGKIVRGVTTIIGENLGWNKNALIGWARKKALAGEDPTTIKEEAGNIGTISHYLCESDAKGIKPDTSQYSKAHIDIAKICFLGYLEWKKLHNIKEIKSEIPLVSELYRFGGTIDMLYKSDGKWILGDIKTSSGIYVDHKIQVSAYYQLLKEFGYDIKEVYILHLAKNGEFAQHKLPNIDKYWQVFLRCLELDRLKREIEWNAPTAR